MTCKISMVDEECKNYGKLLHDVNLCAVVRRHQK